MDRIKEAFTRGFMTKMALYEQEPGVDTYLGINPSILYGTSDFYDNPSENSTDNANNVNLLKLTPSYDDYQVQAPDLRKGGGKNWFQRNSRLFGVLASLAYNQYAKGRGLFRPAFSYSRSF